MIPRNSSIVHWGVRPKKGIDLDLNRQGIPNPRDFFLIPLGRGPLANAKRSLDIASTAFGRATTFVILSEAKNLFNLLLAFAKRSFASPRMTP